MSATPPPPTAAARRDVLDQPEPVIIGLENLPGLMGPDTAIVTLRSGLVLLIGDEGINVFTSREAMNATGIPDQCLCFSTGEEPS